MTKEKALKKDVPKLVKSLTIEVKSEQIQSNLFVHVGYDHSLHILLYFPITLYLDLEMLNLKLLISHQESLLFFVSFIHF